MIEISNFAMRDAFNLVATVIDDLDGPPEDLHFYDREISWVQAEMHEYYELDQFRLGFAYLIKHPEIPLANFIKSYYPETYERPEVLRTLLMYLYEKIWGPDLPSDDEIAQVQLSDMTYQQWRYLGSLRRRKKISKGAIAYWLTALAANLGQGEGYFAIFVDQATALMQQYKEWICMKYGFAYVLRNPELSVQPFVAPAFFTSEEELRQVIADFYQKVWGELPPVEDMEGVELVDTKLSLWRHWWIHSKDWSPTKEK